MKHTTLHDALRVVLLDLDRVVKDNPHETAEWRRGVEAARATVRGLMVASVRPAHQAPLEVGSLAERVVAYCRVRPGTVLTDEEISERFAPGLPPADVFHHLQPAILNQYLETCVVHRSRGYRRFGSSKELEAIRR